MTSRLGPRKVHRPIRTVEDLAVHLQWALSVELSTIPPYLTALYSVVDSSSEAYRLVRSVALEEMLHAALVANLLNAIGAHPSLAPNFLPHYPGFIPHHAAGGPFIQLEPLSPTLARNVFMAIEQPEPSPRVPAEGDEFKTIGQFYKAIEEGFVACVDRYGEQAVFGNDTGHQHTDVYFGAGAGRLFRIDDLVSARQAIIEITQQGEGATHPQPPVPGEEPFGGYNHYGRRLDGTYGPILGTPWELSHYRKFAQIADSDVEMPATHPMAANPSNDRVSGEVRALTELFNGAYTQVICGLQATFTSSDLTVGFFQVAFPIMQDALPYLATLLMQTPLELDADPELGPNAGPEFLQSAEPLADIVARAEQLLTHPPNLGTAYRQIWEDHLQRAVATLGSALSAVQATTRS